MLTTLIVATALARGPDPDEANHFYDLPATGEGVSVAVEDAWARPHQAKLKVVVRNDSKDFLVIRTGQMLFSAYGQAWAEDQVKVVSPRSKTSRVLEFKGSDLKADGAWFVPGGFYRIPTDGDPIAAPNFALPATTNSFEAGPFACTVYGKIEKETKETSLRFRCRFEGVGLGLVDTSALSVIVDGKEYPTTEGNGRLRAVRPGDDLKLKARFEVPRRVADMQFAAMEIHFNDAFREGIPEALPEWDPLQLEVDWKKTN